MKTQQLFTISALFITFCSMLSLAAAAGVASPYWNSAGNENPLYIAPGESQNFALTLQNMVGNEDLQFKATITKGAEVLSITDASDQYFVPAGSNNVPVNLRAQIPAIAPIGTVYNVRMDFLSSPVSESGQFQFGSGYAMTFDIIVREKPVVQNAPLTEGSKTMYYVIASIIILILIIVVILIKRKYK